MSSLAAVTEIKNRCLILPEKSDNVAKTYFEP